MENWEFLLQRKGDKSWLPLESPTVEILEGQYRLAARSALANALVGIAIAYRPLADVRHQPLQQKIVKRISHDGLLIVMPYTNFVPGQWQIDCLATESDPDSTDTETVNTNIPPTWRKTVKFDVIQISSEAGSDWQYSDPEEALEIATDIPNNSHTNALGIVQTEPTPLSYSSPILDIAEQRSTELVQSMFEEFALFNDDELDDEPDNELDNELDDEREDAAQATLSLKSSLLGEGDRSNLEQATTQASSTAQTDIPLQPRILLRLKQPQYIINEDNSFNLTGDIYTQGELEVTLKDPQTLEVLVSQRYLIADSSDRNPVNGAIPFKYQIQVPPPSEIQVLIGEVQIHPQQDFQPHQDLLDQDLFVCQQAIAVSYPASRVLPELIKEAQKQNSESNSQGNLQPTASGHDAPSYPQIPQSFPQASLTPDNQPNPPSPKTKSNNFLSLPPLPSNKPKVSQGEPQRPATALSLPPLPQPRSQATGQNLGSSSSTTDEDLPHSFPQVEATPDQIDSNSDLTSFELTNIGILDGSDRQNRPLLNDKEPELYYSFEEELPQNYEELLEQPRLETSLGNLGNSQLPLIKDHPPQQPNHRFLNKLQTLSADAIAAQKASQRTEELLLDNYTSEPLPINEPLENTAASIDLDNPDRIRTISESTSLAELDRELDVQLDRLLDFESDLILNEYVWEETTDPNAFPVGGLSSSNASAYALTETAKTIRNIQESSPQSFSEQEPIPIPELLIPAGEIISGTPMLITVRLPVLTTKFFVKFWIKDLQTRIIVDGPRWLLDFSVVPNTEFIETRTHISIPLSSIDVAFEAIAIEAQTQRESHKVRVTRAVTPPNLAQDINFDEQ
ncbi:MULTISPECIES: hypothetical protein [Pseudanabaena]|uniref:Uncharacterized protein n=2 Tax=Pseudanabaena TaxID=1152 RepID=L8MYC7_9CYAN|nr:MULTISPECIES: hypothetical protein [Pseudanabaena]ELS33012.1 hypothetical protein Pse7429DRAFT_1834 [Pseudanabaena biceps PCC 7429]MDG3494772.1 hypothetical protein [Pseudanabaena catenata USMAC16]